MADGGLEGVLDFLYEMGLLKRSRRTGWWVAGVDDPESIADHTFRTAVIGYALATLEGADAGRTAVMCLLHDSQETRTGDIDAVGKAYVTAASNEAVTDRQTAALPERLGAAIGDVVAEYERHASVEARLAHDADKLELALQAREYQLQGGHDTADWLRSALDALTTPAARRLADAACRVRPDHWWRVAIEQRPPPPGHPS